MNIALLFGTAAAATWLTGDDKRKENGGDRLTKKSSGVDDIQKIINNEMKMPSYKDYDYQVYRAIGETSNDDEEVIGERFQNPSAEFKAITTDFVNKWFLADKANIFEFMKLTINTFVNGLDAYCESRNIDRNRIRFVYKGGNILRIVAKEFLIELPGYASDIVDDFYMKYFKRSDADFTIYIDPSFKEFDTILNELTILSYSLQQTIRDQMTITPERYFNFYRLNADAQQVAMDELLDSYNAAVSLDDPINAEFYGGKFEGVKHGSAFSGYEPTGQSAAPDIFIQQKEKETVSFSPEQNVTNNLRIQVNTALEFGKGDQYAAFNLVRTKILFKCRFLDSDNTMQNKTIGGELIDVSIPKKNTRELKHFFDHSNVISKYVLRYKDKEDLSFYALTLDSLIADLDKILFIMVDYPWNDNKYKKRINRLFYLCFIELFIKFKGNDNRKKYMMKWCKQIGSQASKLGSTLEKNTKHFSSDLGFGKLAKRVGELSKAVKKDQNLSVDYQDFVETLQENCVVILKAFKNIGKFCNNSNQVPVSTIYDAKLNALIQGDN